LNEKGSEVFEVGELRKLRGRGCVDRPSVLPVVLVEGTLPS
jgi:hypothetical protein